MLLICDQKQNIVAKYRISLGPFFSKTFVIDNSHAAAVLEVLKNIEPHLFAIEACYPAVGDSFFLLNPNSERTQMDIENVLATYEAKHHKQPKAVTGKTIYICPAPAELPDDGVLEYVNVESVYDLKNVPDRCVVLLRDDQLDVIKCIREYPDLFNLNISTLTGVPTSNYSIAFDEATWAYDKVAYAPFISELRLAGEIESQLEVQNQTVYGAEKAQYTRKSGEVKELKNFQIANLGTDDDIADDEMSL